MLPLAALLLNPALLMRPLARRAAPCTMAAAPTETATAIFGDLQLRGVLASRIIEEDFKVATPIQSAAMMPIHRGEHAVLTARPEIPREIGVHTVLPVKDAGSLTSRQLRERSITYKNMESDIWLGSY